MKKSYLILSVALVSFAAILVSGCEKEDPDAISMDIVNKGIQVVEGADGKQYEVVDLGLTSGNLWAVCNIGASSPEQAGSFYAWGELEPKQSYEWSNYTWNDGNAVATESSITKYSSTDGLINLQKSDDMPNVKLGDGWFIPSESDFKELLTTRNCTVKWCKLNGVGGYLFTSVRKGYEGNSLFLPLSGMKDHNIVKWDGQYGWYWCNSIYYDGEKQKLFTTEASVMMLGHTDLDNHYISSRTRNMGLPIRPIFSENNY